MIMMPSSPMFTTPPRSVYTAPSDASRIGIVTRIADAMRATLNRGATYSIAQVSPHQLESWRVGRLDYYASLPVDFGSPTFQLSNSSTSGRFRRRCCRHHQLRLAFALCAHVPGQQFVRHDDGQNDDRLQDNDDLFGHPGAELHPRRPAVQKAEQQGRRNDSQGVVLGQQRHGDPEEAESLGEVDVEGSEEAQDV